MQRATAGLTSVITVNFDAGGLLVAAARSVLASTIPVELLVADNGSTDGSLDGLRAAVGSNPRVRILESGANVGFARANNRALAEARGEWLLFLNPDCVIRPDTIARMQEALGQHPDAGLAGCMRAIVTGRSRPAAGGKRPRPARLSCGPSAWGGSSAASAWRGAPLATSCAPAIRCRRSRSRF